MKIDLVLTACNNNEEYLKMYPYVFKIWKKKFNLECYLILIDNEIPIYLDEFKDFIILFPPLDDINTIFIAQNIRLLFPAMFKEKNVLITDLDIIPVSKKYFIDPIEKYNDDIFISYTERYLNQNMLAICYNVANSEVWKKIFGISSINDIISKLKEWYLSNYTGVKNGDGWFTDQKKLFSYIENYKNDHNDKVVILNDKDIGFKRLDKRSKDIINIIENKNQILENLNNYSDIHISKRIWRNGMYQVIMKDIFKKLS